MTTKELLDFFERYYGEKYSGVFLETMLSYFEDSSPGFRKATAEVITMRFSRIYNKVPDVAIIEKHFDEIKRSIPKPKMIEEKEEEAQIITREEWADLKKRAGLEDESALMENAPFSLWEYFLRKRNIEKRNGKVA